MLAWLASLSTMIAILFAPYSAFKGHQPSLTEAALYLSIHRTAWAIALGWLVFACSTERGGPINRLLSWSAFGPLSNLSYLAYLVHPLLMLYHTGRTRERVYFGHYELVRYNFISSSVDLIPIFSPVNSLTLSWLVLWWLLDCHIFSMSLLSYRLHRWKNT